MAEKRPERLEGAQGTTTRPEFPDWDKSHYALSTLPTTLIVVVISSLAL